MEPIITDVKRIAVAHPMLRFGGVLLGEFLEPPGGFRRVLFHAMTFRIAVRHGCQGLGIALFGGFSVPLDGLGFVLFHTPATGIAAAQLTLGPDMALLGGYFQVFDPLGPVGLLLIQLKQLLRGFHLLGGSGGSAARRYHSEAFA